MVFVLSFVFFFFFCTSSSPSSYFIRFNFCLFSVRVCLCFAMLKVVLCLMDGGFHLMYASKMELRLEYDFRFMLLPLDSCNFKRLS